MTTLKERALIFLGWRDVPGEVEVPLVNGLRLETARQRCLEDGLLFGVDEPDLGPRSVVVAQSPPSGTLVADYTTVRVRVAMKRARWHPRPWRWWVGKILSGL